MLVYGCGFNGFSQVTALSEAGSSALCLPVLIQLQSTFPVTQNVTTSGADNIESESSDDINTSSAELSEHPATGDLGVDQKVGCVVADDQTESAIGRLPAQSAVAAISWGRIYFLVDGKLQTSTSSADISDQPDGFKQVCSRGLRHICCGWQTICIVDSHPGSCHITDTASAAFHAVRDGEEFVSMTTNDINILALTSDRTLFAIDRQSRDSIDSETLVPRPLLPGLCVRTVSCGKHHTLLLSAIGVVFSFGGGGQGQLGHGGIDSEPEPRIVEALEGLTMTTIAAGGWHSLSLSDAGDVYVWGWNERGQLGLPCPAISGKAGKVSMGTTEASEMVSDESSNDNFVNVLTIPHVLDLPIDPDEVIVTRITCGSRHTAALAEDGTLMTWGWNEYGQLGLGDAVSRDSPTIVGFFAERNLSVVDVFAGCWNTIFVCRQLCAA